MTKNLSSSIFQAGILILISTSLLITSCTKPKHEVDHPEYFDEILSKGKALADSGYPVKAFNYLDSCYAEFHNPSNFDLYRKYLIKCDYYHVEKRDYKIATIYVDSMLLMVSEHPELHISAYSNSLIAKGHIQFGSHNYIDAFKSYYDGKQFALKYADSCSYAALSNGLGMVLYAQQKYKEAIVYFKAASFESRYCIPKDEIRLFQKQQGYMDNIALCYEQANMLDSAVFYYNQVLKFIESRENNLIHKDKSKKIAKAVVYGNLGGTYAKMGRYLEAEQLLKSSIETNNKKGYDKRDAQLTMIKLANMNLDMGRFDDAKKYLQIARVSLDSLAFDKAELRWKKLAWKYYDKIGNIPMAYHHHKEYALYKTEYDSLRKELAGLDFSETFENLSQQYQIDILKKDNRLKTLYLLIFSALCTIILLIVYFTWKNNKNTKKNLKELKKLNEEISELNTLKDKILAILAHDIKGPIASITGLLNVEGQNLNAELIANAKQKLRKQLLTVNDLLDNILHWASSSFKNKSDQSKEVVQIGFLIQKNIDILKSIAEEKQIQITNNITDGWNCFVNIEQLKIVFRNILANAIKFTPAGGQIKIDIRSSNDLLFISITDTGTGMNKEQLEKLFSTKHNSNYGTKGEKGIGLGLLITKEYVELNEGTISINSVEGKGTEVIIGLKCYNQKYSD